MTLQQPTSNYRTRGPTMTSSLKLRPHRARDHLRPVLDSHQCPTVVMRRTGDGLVPVSNGHYLAESIPGEQMVEREGDTHAPEWGDVETVLSLTEESATGHDSTPRPAERVLATILFTDIVDSTALAAALGDSIWRQVLDRHDKICQS